MEKRKKYLSDLQSFIGGVDQEVTLILQSLQWDRKHLLEGSPMVSCQYSLSHRIPQEKKEIHEKECSLKCQGYIKHDRLLPDPFDGNADTVVKLSTIEISHIIKHASQQDPAFKKGGYEGPSPLSLGRLQAAYSADERRAIHDAVVAAVPTCHDLADLALLGSNEESAGLKKQKSRVEILAELRDMKRRRTKYRVAAKTRNYSDALRDVIATQMELYRETQVKALIDNTQDTRKDSQRIDNKERLDDKDIGKRVRDRMNDRESSHREYWHGCDRSYGSKGFNETNRYSNTSKKESSERSLKYDNSNRPRHESNNEDYRERHSKRKDSSKYHSSLKDGTYKDRDSYYAERYSSKDAPNTSNYDSYWDGPSSYYANKHSSKDREKGDGKVYPQKYSTEDMKKSLKDTKHKYEDSSYNKRYTKDKSRYNEKKGKHRESRHRDLEVNEEYKAENSVKRRRNDS